MSETNNLHEFVFTLIKCLGCGYTFLFNQFMQCQSQRLAAHPDEAPRLRQTDAGRMMGGLKQAPYHSRRNGGTSKVAHVAPLENGALHNVALD